MERSATRTSMASTVSTKRSANRASMESTETMETEHSLADNEAMDEEPAEQDEDWWRILFRNPATAPWNIDISREDFEGIQEGFTAYHHSDRWYIKAMPREESSNITLVHFRRFMAESPDYTIVIHSSRATGEERISIVAIIWETIETLLSLTGDHISEDYAKREVVYLARQFLSCELPGLDEVRHDEWWPKWAAWKNRILEGTP